MAASVPPPKILKEDIRGRESAPKFYSNYVNLTVSPWDLRLQFCQMDDVTRGEDGATVTYTNVVTVYLSPGQARALRKLLTDKAGKHEEVWRMQERILADVGEEPESPGQ
jgi:hypothetical protein